MTNDKRTILVEFADTPVTKYTPYKRAKNGNLLRIYSNDVEEHAIDLKKKYGEYIDITHKFKYKRGVYIDVYADIAEEIVNGLKLYPKIKKVEIIKTDLRDLYSSFISSSAVSIRTSQVKADLAHNMGYKGNAAKVCVIDTGAYPFPQLKKFINCLVDPPQEQIPYDDYGHGSSVCNCVLEVAPEAWLYVCKATEGPVVVGAAYARGVEWAIDNGMDIINISAAPMGDLTAAYNAGIITTGASGNGGPEDQGYDIDRTDWASDLTMNVGGINENNEARWSAFYYLWTYSISGHNLTCVAPAVVIPDEEAGTSFAAPSVAGLCALLYSIKPTISPAECKQTIQSTAVDLGLPSHPGHDWIFGYGLIDAYAAVRKALCNTPTCSININ